jgi:hypothetical protein
MLLQHRQGRVRCCYSTGRLAILIWITHSIKPNGDSFSHEEAVKLLDQYSRAPAVLELKVGSQVMLVVNKPKNEGLCNGSV